MSTLKMGRRIGRVSLRYRRRKFIVYLNAGRKLEGGERQALLKLFMAARAASHALDGSEASFQVTTSTGIAVCRGLSPSLALGLATRVNAVVDGKV